MDLSYQRCPEDNAKVMSAEIALDGGQVLHLGLPEIATGLQMKGCVYSTTLAIKGGVPGDFVARTAVGLSKQLGVDVHALCPVIGVMCECHALMLGGKVVVGEDGQISIFPGKACPAFLHGYFSNREST